MTHRRGAAATKFLITTLVLAAGGAGAWVALGRPGAAPAGEGSPSAKLLQTEMAIAQKQSFEITVTATGDLQAKNQIEIKSELETESSIAEIAPEGKVVKKGDLLVRLNSDQISTQLEESKLQVETARSNLIAAQNALKIQQSENESSLRQQELKLEVAKLDLQQWLKGVHVQKLKDIELSLDKTAKDLERLEEKFERSQKLFAQGFLSKNELQLDEIALRDARAARDKAMLEQKTYNDYQVPKDRRTKESAVEEATEQLERVKQQNEIRLTGKRAELANAETTLKLRSDRMEKLQRQLAATEMRAPQDGLVIYATNAGRNWGGDEPFAVGRRVRPQESLIVLPDTRQMVAAVRVPEAIAGRVRRGQSATIKVDKLPGQSFTGEIDEISILAETQDRWRDPNRREYTVKVLLDDPTSAGEVELRPSDRAEATIVLGRVQDAVAVPLQAVFTEDQVQYVWTPAGTRFQRVPVRIGRRSDTFAEIAAGLEPDARVLLREPTPGERGTDPWREDQLKLVGFRVGENGRPERIAPPGGVPGQRPPRQRPGGAAGGPPGAAPESAPAGGGEARGRPARPGSTETAQAAPAKTEAVADAKTPAPAETPADGASARVAAVPTAEAPAAAVEAKPAAPAEEKPVAAAEAATDPARPATAVVPAAAAAPAPETPTKP